MVADTHGEFEILVELLQKHGVINRALQWSFGSGHLAVLGDVFDRGPNHTEIFWLLYELEAQARAKGGGLHFVLGNHETLALLGARQYLNPKYRASAQALGVPAYALLWDEHTLLGRWLRTKPSVQKIGGYLCLHGGLSAEIVNRGYTLAVMNQSVRDMLTYTPAYLGTNDRYAPDDLRVLANNPAATQADRDAAVFLVMHPLGPLWYRGYFPQAARESGFPRATDEDVSRVLRHFDARAIFVGHTMVPTVTPLYDGKVIAVQVYPRRDDAGSAHMEALLVKEGVLYRARIDGGVEELPQRILRAMNLELLGYIGALLTTASFIPQAIMTIRSRDTRGISRGMYIIFTTGVAFWLAYGIAIDSLPMILANTVTLGLAGTVLALKLRYG